MVTALLQQAYEEQQAEEKRKAEYDPRSYLALAQQQPGGQSTAAGFGPVHWEPPAGTLAERVDLSLWLVVREHGSHGFEYTVTPDQLVKENRCDVHQDDGEEGKSQVVMRMPQ